MGVRFKVVLRGVLFGVLPGAVPALVLACFGLASGDGGLLSRLGTALALVASGASVGFLPGTAVGVALAFSPQTVWNRPAHASAVAGGAASGVMLLVTLSLAVASGSGVWAAAALVGTPLSFLIGWFVSTPVAAPLRKQFEAAAEPVAEPVAG
ncbi:hypothetical protein [Kitasatospora sp. NPDC002040]|uniref:hypothetical protein n=1 Tax=Kitasatospora sp. NPDC002040 TaxID=3154661 RepID=UPI00331937C2